MYDAYPISGVGLVRHLIQAFETKILSCPTGPDSLRSWTMVTKQALRDLGQARGLEVYCSGGISGYEEFLVDVMWWNPDTMRPDALFESEWGTVDEIAFDFQKLLFMKAPLKAMICDPEQHRSGLVPKIETWIREYPDHLKGEHYLLVNLCGEQAGGNPECFEWQAVKAGRAATPVCMAPIAGSPFRYRLATRDGRDRP